MTNIPAGVDYWIISSLRKEPPGGTIAERNTGKGVYIANAVAYDLEDLMSCKPL
jgi:hypothetical protein